LASASETCFAFGDFVYFYINELGMSREITVNEALEIMGHSSERRTTCMVLTGILRVCAIGCSCCCGVVGGLRAFGAGKTRVALSNCTSVLDESWCGHCDTCAERCPTTVARADVNGIQLEYDA